MQVWAMDRRHFERELTGQLVAAGNLDAGDIERVNRLKTASGDRLEMILTRLGLVSENEVANALAQTLDLQLVEREEFPDRPLLEGKISARFLRDARALPIANGPEGIVLAMADPLDEYTVQSVRVATNQTVLRRVARPADLDAAFERLYGGERSVLNDAVVPAAIDDEQALDDITRLKDLASEAPVVRLVNCMITRAVETRASDIHIEPYDGQLVVRLRIDGVLREIESPPFALRAAIVSRIKIMARLNIAERRLPQDGRIRFAVRGREIDLRISTAPTLHGESVVLRILDRGSLVLDFAALGFSADALQQFLDVLRHPHGVLLVTGPTGSGKTTTLYASVARLNTSDKKIITVEDPVEYQLDGVNQIQVKPQIGLTFAQTLRSILRHDPDIILVGEIRDFETAEIAIQAALTGHLVLSTLHTNDAPSTLTRLLDMGVADYLIVSTLNAVIAQRLVRTLCEHCRDPYRAMPELLAQIRAISGTDAAPVTLYRPSGCEHCNGMGFRGRTAIFELLPMQDEVRRIVLTKPDAAEIRRAAIALGMRTMYEDGVAKALAGVTTIEEVLRVTRSD